MDHEPNRENRSLSRRTVLRSGAAGAVVGGLTLAGCMGGDDDDSADDGNGDDGNGADDGNGDDGNGDDMNGDDDNGEDNGEDDDPWMELFNGEDIDDWTPKIRYEEAGDDPLNTFIVEDGLLKVNYDEYGNFQDMDEPFGHLFYDDEFSHYILYVEYRFVGEQVEGGEGWAYRNNGLMLHGEDPEEMDVDKDFPRSVEFQLLGDDRSNGDLCTPDTQAVDMDGQLRTDHCWHETAGSSYYHDEWVTAIAVVRGDELVQHILEEDGIVLEYQETQLEDGTPIDEGTISLQSESHPTEFRTIELLELDPDDDFEPSEIPPEVEERLD